MSAAIKNISLIVVIAPLLGSLAAGFFGKLLGRTTTHRLTITLMFVSLCSALWVWWHVVFQGASYYGTVYVWGSSVRYHFVIGFMIDQLTAWMMVIVTFVSTFVHIYSIGYMADDPGYQRFFCYMSLFTFSMLMLVMSNNFLQLFFGWEAVGLVSYLLIGFWFNKETAVAGSLKAFLVNRVGDFGFIIGVAAVMTYFQTLDYHTVFAKAPALYKAQAMIAVLPGTSWSVLSLICIALFIGAMGKSAQMPLHVWLPESMEGPTPISALIHAATMVTAGVFMVSRMSPLFELSPMALTIVLVIGATSALFTGIIAIVVQDIKRIIAYSTLSQLGYMIAACGASAFSAGMFHLLTHACFKALLFLASGSVIIAMHHEQDIRKMGGLSKYMPITTITFLVGALALSAIPPFAGFYSKDAIIEAVGISKQIGSDYAYICLLLGSFVTAVYSFRAYFLVFHGKEKIPAETKKHVRESPWVVTLPLVVLAIPSALLGAIMVGPFLFKQQAGWLGKSIKVLPQYNVIGQMAKEFHGWFLDMVHSIVTLPFWFAISGVFVAWFVCIYAPGIREKLTKRFHVIHNVLMYKYGFNEFNEIVFAGGGRKLGEFFYRVTDVGLIDTLCVNGSARAIQWTASVARHFQSGFLYHYAFVMIVGLLGLLAWLELSTNHLSLFSFFYSNVI